MPNATQIANVPESVTVVFPRADDGVLGTDHYIQTVLGSGHPGTELIHSTAVANFTGGANPVNVVELTELTAQVAADFYAWRLASLEVRYENPVPWIADGLHDVEYLHDANIATAIHRSDWEPEFGQLKHVGTYGSSDTPVVRGIITINGDGTPDQLITSAGGTVAITQPVPGTTNLEVAGGTIVINYTDINNFFDYTQNVFYFNQFDKNIYINIDGVWYVYKKYDYDASLWNDCTVVDDVLTIQDEELMPAAVRLGPGLYKSLFAVDFPEEKFQWAGSCRGEPVFLYEVERTVSSLTVQTSSLDDVERWGVHVNGHVAAGGGSGSGISGGGGTIAKECCPDRLLPEKLYYVTSMRTGDCVCLPDDYGEMNYVPATGQWDAEDITTCDLTTYPYLRCNESEEWDLTGFGFGAATLVSLSCDPFELVVDFDGGVLCPGGTFRITVFE